jgi:hypothetical protein
MICGGICYVSSMTMTSDYEIMPSCFHFHFLYFHVSVFSLIKVDPWCPCLQPTHGFSANLLIAIGQLTELDKKKTE